MASDKQTGRKAAAEYADARDDEAFWAAVELEREPARQRWYIAAIVLLVAFSVPWYFASGSIGAIVAGLPVWVWLSLGCSVGLSTVTAIAVLRFWVDSKEDD